MKYAIRILEEERKVLLQCLSEWQSEKYPDAKREREVKVELLTKAIICLSKVENGINPLIN